MSKKIALYNSFNFHYEMYGYIINYCQKYNHELVIYTNHDINYNWLRFYKTFFTKYSFRILDYTTFEKNKDTYDHIILATDDDKKFKNEWANIKTICIDHASRNRRPQTPHHISTRPFNQQNNDWALPCFPITNYSNKITHINEDVINIAIVGGTHSLPNGQYNVNVINRLNPGENKKIIIHAICRHMNHGMFVDIKNTIELKVYSHIDTYEMMNVLQTCSYLLTDVDYNVGHITGGSMGGGVPLAFSHLMPLIISKGNNNIYKFKSAIEFDMDSTDDIMLSNDIYASIQAVGLEREYLMSMIDIHLQKIINPIVEKNLITSIPPILICHYAKLIDRKKHLLLQFNNNNITNYEFIDHFDRDTITNDERRIFDDNVTNMLAAVHLTHIYAYKEIEDKYDHALILEDDVILTDAFVNKLQEYLTQLPEDYDMLFIGDGCNHHIAQDKLVPNVNIYKRCLFSTPTSKEEFASRCSDSYIVSKKCAIKLNKYIHNLTSKISSPIDWWLNDAAKDNDLNIYWAEPTIVTQGSQRGLFSSSIGNCSNW